MSYPDYIPLSDELCIKWRVSPEKLPPFVRTRIVSSHFRARPVTTQTEGRVFGYAVLKSTAQRPKGGYFLRRVFYLTPKDLQPDCIYRVQGDILSMEGVDPRTIEPGWWGE